MTYLEYINGQTSDEFTDLDIGTKSWKIDFDEKRILPIMVEEAELVGQEAWGDLSVERYGWYIHTDGYGVEFAELYGLPIDLVLARLETNIREALSIDERIESVDNFIMEAKDDGKIIASFEVHTIYGTVEQEIELNA